MGDQQQPDLFSINASENEAREQPMDARGGPDRLPAARPAHGLVEAEAMLPNSGVWSKTSSRACSSRQPCTSATVSSHSMVLNRLATSMLCGRG